MKETRVQSLGWEVPLENGMAIHSSILAWRIPWTEKPGGLQSVGSQRVGHNRATNTHTSPFECIYGRPFLCTDFVIDPEALELTSYVTQLSAFQQTLTELQEMTPDPASESSKPLFEPGTEVLIKTLGSGVQSLEPLWESPHQVILSSPTAVKVPGIDL